MRVDIKRQCTRPNRFKPSVVQEHGFWWARVYEYNGGYVAKLFTSQQEALVKAYELAEANRELAA